MKPDNIFLLADGHVKILDFGLARSAGGDGAGSGPTETVAALTDPGLVMGTIGYMAPEQVRGRVVDGRADLSRSARRSTKCSPAGAPSRATRRPTR